MNSLIKIASKVNQGLCCVILLTMVGFVFVNTALRYFFSSGIIITEELVRYLFLWGTYLGVISVWYNRGHIAVTTITDRLSARHKIIFSGCFEIVSIIVLLTLAYGSYLYFMDTTTVGQVTNIPYSVMIVAVLIGTLSCSVISIGHIKQDLQMLKLDDATLERMAKEQEEAMLNPKEEE